jgi:hypothetical protein
MVSRSKLALAVVALAALLTFLFAATALAKAEDKPTVQETYQVTINEVGDGHVVDTIKYSKDDYAAIKKVANKKRSFLTRRYTAEDNTGELVDFNTEMDDATHSVVITYDKPGMAYSTEGSDFVYYGGFSAKPKAQAGNRFTFEDTTTVNSEFTLFTDQVFKTTSDVTLPASSSAAKYDSGDQALKYQMPAARTTYGFWGEQRVTLSVIFGLLTLVFAGTLILVIRRKPIEATAGAAAMAPVAQPAPPSVTPDASTSEAKPADGPQHRFCSKCGSKLESGKHFCTNCGAKAD